MPAPTASSNRAHSSDGRRADRSPPRPASGAASGTAGATVLGSTLSEPAPGCTGSADGCGGGTGSVTSPTSLATTTYRWAALYLGLQVVSVSRLSVVGSTTLTSLG